MMRGRTHGEYRFRDNAKAWARAYTVPDGVDLQTTNEPTFVDPAFAQRLPRDASGGDVWIGVVPYWLQQNLLQRSRAEFPPRGPQK